MLYQLAVLIHLLSAVVYAGGMLFLVLVLVPVVRRGANSREEATRLLGQVGRQFRPVGWVCLILLVASGAYLAADHWGIGVTEFFQRADWFARTLQIKTALVAVVLALSAFHDFVLGPRLTKLIEASLQTGPLGLPEIRQNRRTVVWIARANLLLVLAIIVAAVMLTRGSPF